MAKELRAKSVVVQGDSQLIIGQVNGTYEAKEERTKRYLRKFKHCIKGLITAKFYQVPREENIEANSLARAVYSEYKRP